MVAVAIQRRGGSAAAHATFTGLQREATIDTDASAWRVHDGATAGGWLGGGIKRASAGAVLRSLHDKVLEVLSVKEFGAKGDMSVDDTAAFNAAIAAALAARNETCVYVPSGVYKLTSRLSFTLAPNQTLTIRGDGKNVSELRWTAANGGIAATYDGTGWWFIGENVNTANCLNVLDLSLTTTINGSSGTAIFVNGSSIKGRPMMETCVHNVSARGADGNGFWDVGIDLLDTADTIIDKYQYVGHLNTITDGVGIRYRATPPTGTPPNQTFYDPTLHYVTNFRQYYGSVGILASDYIEGIHVSNAGIVAVGYGVFWSTATSESQLIMRGAHIAASNIGIYMKNVMDSQISASWFIRPDAPASTWAGIQLDACGSTTITGNLISGRGTDAENGIILDNSISTEDWFNDRPNVFSGNVLRAINGTAIWLKANTSNAHVADNNFSSVVRRVLNEGRKIGNTRNTNRSRHDGALVTRRGSNQSIPSGALTTVQFDTRDDDTGELDGGSGGAIANLGSFPTRLRVPIGYSRVRLTGQVSLSNSPTLRQMNIICLMNGSINFPANGNQSIATDTGTQQNIGWTLNLQSGILNVTPGDYFEIGVYALNDGNAINILASGVGHTTWFQMECVE